MKTSALNLILVMILAYDTLQDRENARFPIFISLFVFNFFLLILKIQMTYSQQTKEDQVNRIFQKENIFYAFNTLIIITSIIMNKNDFAAKKGIKLALAITHLQLIINSFIKGKLIRRFAYLLINFLAVLGYLVVSAEGELKYFLFVFLVYILIEVILVLISGTFKKNLVNQLKDVEKTNSLGQVVKVNQDNQSLVHDNIGLIINQGPNQVRNDRFKINVLPLLSENNQSISQNNSDILFHQSQLLYGFYQSLASFIDDGLIMYKENGDIIYKNDQINSVLNIGLNENHKIVEQLIQFLMKIKQVQNKHQYQKSHSRNKIDESISPEIDNQFENQENLIRKIEGHFRRDSVLILKDFSQKNFKQLRQPSLIELSNFEILLSLLIENQKQQKKQEIAPMVENIDQDEENQLQQPRYRFRQSFCNTLKSNSRPIIQNGQKTDINNGNQLSFLFKKDEKLLGVKFYLIETHKSDENIKDQIIVVQIVDHTQLKLELNQRKNLNIMSHHFRSPLNTSIGLLQLCKNQLQGGLFEKYVLKALNSNYLLLNSLNSFLDLEMINMGEGLEYQLDQFDIKEIYEELEKIFFDQLKLKDINLNFENHLEKPIIKSDQKRLMQCFIQFISNSLQFSPAKSVIRIIIENHKKEKSPYIELGENEDSCAEFNFNFQSENSIIKSINSSNSYDDRNSAALNNIPFNKDMMSGVNFHTQSERKVMIQVNSAQSIRSDEERKIEGQNIKISIRDYGVGMRENEIHEIMSRYETGGNLQTTGDQNSSMNRSLGFGLSSSMKILSGLCPPQYQQNPIQIKTNPNKGCKISFKIRDFSAEQQDDSFKKRINFQKKSVILSKSNDSVQIIQRAFSGNQYSSSGSIQVDHAGFSGELANQGKMFSENLSESGNQGQVRTPKTTRHQSIFAVQSPLSMASDPILHLDHKCFQAPVLIVDDIQFNILSLKYMFEDFQIETDHVYNGQEAVERIQYRSRNGCSNCLQYYKLILMDIDMPIKNGYEASMEICSYLKNQQLPANVIACTAYFSANDVQISQQSGMLDFITKPILPEIFGEIVKKYL